jgi:hypothetical protein
MKIKLEKSEFRLTNWLSMVINMISPKNLYLIVGRGAGKTSDILAGRAQDIVHDMPGAPLAFVGDTYTNLLKNTAKTFIEGWERLGWIEADGKTKGHFVVDKQPPDYFKKPFTKFKSFKHTISTFTGANFTLVSMDRPSSGAGSNYVHVLGDEVKYFKKNKIKKLTPAIRGSIQRFGHSPYFRGRTFTTDFPDMNRIDEDDWILDLKKNMNKEQIKSILDCAFILNAIRIEYQQAEQTKNVELLKKVAVKLVRWEKRYYKIRMNSTFFYIASSFVNADILTEGYFPEQLADGSLEDYLTSILSMKPAIEKGMRFYGNLSEAHFYHDGYNYSYYDQYGIRDNITQSSRGLKYIRKHEKLETGVDFGNMCSMVIGQEQWPNYRVLKNMHVLTPEWIDHLAKNFIDFFQHHERKELDMYYDRSGNAYSKQKQDFATKLKNAIEKRKDDSGSVKSTGWKVNLMSVGQGNISHPEEFDLMNDLMGNHVTALPKLLIDQFECKELKSSLEMAPVEKDAKGNIKKVKKSEKFPVKRLPMESTNYSDAFKYLMCRKKYMDIVKARQQIKFSDVAIREMR